VGQATVGQMTGHPLKVGNLPSKFGHAMPLGSRINRYVRDGQTKRQTHGRTKATLLPSSLRAGHKKEKNVCNHRMKLANMLRLLL